MTVHRWNFRVAGQSAAPGKAQQGVELVLIDYLPAPAIGHPAGAKEKNGRAAPRARIFPEISGPRT